MPDRNKLNFFTGDPIDKIVAEGTISITNDGATSNAPQSSKIVEQRIPNPYGKKALCRFVYSVDGGASYNGQDAHLAYTYTITVIPPSPGAGFSTTLGGLRAAVSIAVSDSEIIIRTANGYHGNVTDNGSVYGYTPNSQVFDIKYALFEVE
jgi:hypothetical protein